MTPTFYLLLHFLFIPATLLEQLTLYQYTHAWWGAVSMGMTA